MATISLDKKSYGLITNLKYNSGTNMKTELEKIVKFAALHHKRFAEFGGTYTLGEIPRNVQYYITLDESSHDVVSKCSRHHQTSLKRMAIQMVAFAEANLDEFKSE